MLCNIPHHTLHIIVDSSLLSAQSSTGSSTLPLTLYTHHPTHSSYQTPSPPPEVLCTVPKLLTPPQKPQTMALVILLKGLLELRSSASQVSQKPVSKSAEWSGLRIRRPKSTHRDRRVTQGLAGLPGPCVLAWLWSVHFPGQVRMFEDAGYFCPFGGLRLSGGWKTGKRGDGWRMVWWLKIGDGRGFAGGFGPMPQTDHLLSRLLAWRGVGTAKTGGYAGTDVLPARGPSTPVALLRILD